MRAPKTRRRFLGKIELRALYPAWIVILSVLEVFAFYRILLYRRLGEASTPPFGFVLQRFWTHELLASFLWDFLLASLVSAPYFWLCLSRPKTKRSTLFWVSAGVLCFLLGTLSVVHLRMLLDRGEGLGLAVFEEMTIGAMTMGEAWGYGETGDYALVLLGAFAVPVTYFALSRTSAKRMRWVQRGAQALFVALVISAFLPAHRRFPRRIHHNPVQYGLGELSRFAIRGDPLLKQDVRPVSPEQERSLMLVDAQFLEPDQRSVPPIAPFEEPLNVVLVVMESTGAQYVFERTPDGQVAMPFLQELASESWWMARHYSVANSSHRSLFSLFSGLYPSFGRAYFCLGKDVNIPTLGSFLPERYQRFLYTPGELRSYFPRALLQNSGFRELKGQQEIHIPRPRPSPANAHNEFDVLELFQERIRTTKGPFFGVYYSYVPHFHYFDYGPEFRAYPNIDNPRHRYINNLRVLDRVIEEIVATLKEEGAWEHTIFLVVGDHGEAFGQHGFFTHANDSHDEALQAPFLLHFPRAEGRVVDEITSHVDVLPTTLDLLGLPYEKRLIQGESLLAPERRRRYVFTVGNEQSFTSIAQDGTKVLHSFRRDRCEAFQLATDPWEVHPEDCTLHLDQHHALADFRNYQSTILPRYNRSILTNQGGFHGLSHPTLTPTMVPEPN